MISARILPDTYNISAFCPNCQTVTSFENKSGLSVEGAVNIDERTYDRRLYNLCQCASCRRGGLAEIASFNNARDAYLIDFYPFSIDCAVLPKSVPKDIESEFREAEKCAALRANRAASALFRSVLEKVLKANGYTKGNDSSLRDLQKRIDAAAADGIITQARQKRAHEDIRSLGNDVLHEDWREVTDEEVATSHRYTQRILEDIYDDRATVEKMLIEKGKLPADTPNGPPASL